MEKARKRAYEDIIRLPHPVSSKRPQMPVEDRAAQFSPFAALTGYDAAIRETGRLTDSRIELSEDERAALDQKQQLLLEHLAERPKVAVTYFVPDERKNGGCYVTARGRVKRVDEPQRSLVLTDGSGIPLDEIAELEIDLARWKEFCGEK